VAVRTPIFKLLCSAVLVLAACSSQATVSPAPDTTSEPDQAVADQPVEAAASDPTGIPDLRVEDLDLSVEAAAALLELPVTAVPLELVLVHDQEVNVRYIDLAAGRTLTIADGGGITAVWTTGDAIFFERQPGLLNRWDPTTRSVTSTKIPLGDVIGGARQLPDGSLAVHTFNLGVVREFLFVYEPSGEIRCSLETEDALRLPENNIIISKERSEGLDTSAERVFSIDPTTCSKAAQVPKLTRFGRILGGDGEMLVVAEPVSENESRLVRYDFDGGWTEALAGEPIPIRGLPQIGAGAVWAQVWSDGDTDLYRFSPDTFEIEDQWRVSVRRPSSWTVQDDAVWLVGCCGEQLTRLDIESGEVEHFPLPFEDSHVTFMREAAGGLLIGRPSTGYLFNYALRRFERMPDWFLHEARDASRWIVVPGS